MEEKLPTENVNDSLDITNSTCIEKTSETYTDFFQPTVNNHATCDDDEDGDNSPAEMSTFENQKS